MDAPPKKFFVIAGENSGDNYASLLIRGIKKVEPNCEFRGLGGPQMEDCGVTLLEDIVQHLAIIGITQVVKNFRKILKLFEKVEKDLLQYRPDAIILVDYPGFNLRVAKMAKSMTEKLGYEIKVFYYVMPQVWAWHKKRIHTIRENVDLMIVHLEFEKEFCDKHDVPVFYSGHALLDVIKLTRSREEICQKFGFDPNRPLLGLMPGSRKPEIIRILPSMLEACELLHQHDPNLQFVLPRATSVDLEWIEKYMSRYKVPINIVDQERYNVRSIMDFALVKSGTSTLETAILETPMLIIYKTSWLTWMIGKSLLKIHYIGLVNIIADKMVVPEILQDEATGLKISEECKAILYDDEKRKNIQFELRRVKSKLGEPGASDNAGAKILEFLNQNGDQNSNGE